MFVYIYMLIKLISNQNFNLHFTKPEHTSSGTTTPSHNYGDHRPYNWHVTQCNRVFRKSQDPGNLVKIMRSKWAWNYWTCNKFLMNIVYETVKEKNDDRKYISWTILSISSELLITRHFLSQTKKIRNSVTTEICLLKKKKTKSAFATVVLKNTDLGLGCGIYWQNEPRGEFTWIGGGVKCFQTFNCGAKPS